MKLILLFIFLSPVLIDAQVITVVYEKARFPFANPGNMTESIIKRAKKNFSNLRWYHTIKGDNQVITSTLDSLVQHCDAEPCTSNVINKLYLKTEHNRWDFYSALENWNNATDVYEISRDEDEDEWIIDSERCKNILGYNCFRAYSKYKPEKKIWITLELPFSISPFGPLNIPGVVLEFSESSKSSTAIQLEVNWDEEMFAFEKSNYNIQEFKDFREFYYSVLSSSATPKLKSDMFECIKD